MHEGVQIERALSIGRAIFRGRDCMYAAGAVACPSMHAAPPAEQPRGAAPPPLCSPRAPPTAAPPPLPLAHSAAHPRPAAGCRHPGCARLYHRCRRDAGCAPARGHHMLAVARAVAAYTSRQGPAAPCRGKKGRLAGAVAAAQLHARPPVKTGGGMGREAHHRLAQHARQLCGRHGCKGDACLDPLQPDAQAGLQGVQRLVGLGHTCLQVAGGGYDSGACRPSVCGTCLGVAVLCRHPHPMRINVR